MRERTYLFDEDDLAAQLRHRQAQAAQAVDEIPEQQFLISSDQDLVSHVVSRFTVHPLVLREDAARMNQTETQVDVSGEPGRFVSIVHSGPFHILGTRVNVDIPYEGDEWLFKYRTSTYTLSFPLGVVSPGSLRVTVALPHDQEPEVFKQRYDDQLRLIRQFVQRSHAQVLEYNRSLEEIIQHAISHRRGRLRKHSALTKMLDIPLAANPRAPSVDPVKIEIRRPPPLPVPPKTGLQPEPGITDQVYEEILHFIRHQGRTFETTPKTYAVHDEEELRDIILAQLNGHFVGEAVGEAFRRKGKTDIRLEKENRAAFVGECKLWKGPASLSDALDQLLGYLTWRDSKASLIFFNSRNRNFSKILPNVSPTVAAHPLHLRHLPCEEAGEWRVEMRSEENEGRRVTVHIFLFNLYTFPR